MNHGMKAGPPGYLWSKYECFLMSGCRDINLEIKLCRSVTGTRTTRVTAIALLVLRTGELHAISVGRETRTFLFFVLEMQ